MSNTPPRFAGLPGKRPSQIVVNSCVLPLVIVMMYALVAHSTPSYLHSEWFSYAGIPTRPVSAFIPGIARTVGQLEAAGFPDRAAEVGHYLALMWILSGLGVVAWLLVQWLTWTDDNYVWQVAAARRHWEKQSEAKHTMLKFFWIVLAPFWMIGTLFIGEASRSGRSGHNFLSNYFEFFMGIWFIGAQGWVFFFIPGVFAGSLMVRYHNKNNIE